MEQTQLELVANYKPDKHVLAGLSNVHLLMVIGPTGVGKSTLMKASGVPEVIGDASRQPRQGEVSGVDYWFRTEREMLAEADAGQYVQVAMGSEGDLKATHAGSFPTSGPAVFAVVASAVHIFRELPFASTATAVIVPPDFDTWMERISSHHTPPDKLAARLEEACYSYEFALNDESSMFVLNDKLELAVSRLLSVAEGKVPQAHRQAQAIATDLLHHIKTQVLSYKA
jgi:guanylate kinase